MNRLIISIGLLIACLRLPAQPWQELYAATDECWDTDWAACIALLEKALTQAEVEFGKMDSAYALTLNDLGLAMYYRGDYNLALEKLLACHKINQAIFDSTHDDFQSTQNNLGLVYYSLGDYETARQYYEKNLRYTEQHLGLEHPDYGLALNNLASLYKNMGLYEKVVPLLLKALENTENSLGKSHPDYMRYLNNLAAVYQEIGDFEKALSLIKEVIAYEKEEFGIQSFTYAKRLGNLALMYDDMDRYDSAIWVAEQGVRLLDQLVEADNPLYLRASHNLATLYFKTGHQQKAHDIHRKIKPLIAQKLGKQHLIYGACLNSMGREHYALGRLDSAILYAENATKHARLLGGHTLLGGRMVILMNLYEEKGLFEKAKALCFEIAENNLIQIEGRLSSMNQHLQTRFLKRILYRFAFVQSFILENRHDQELVCLGFEQQLLLKGLLQGQRQQFLQRIRQDQRPEIQQKYRQWESIHRKLSRQYQKPARARISSFDSLKNLADQLETELFSASPLFQSFQQANPLSALQGRLDSGKVLLEFHHFQLYRKGFFTDSILYVAYVVKGPDYPIKLVPLFDEKTLLDQHNQSMALNPHTIEQLYVSRGIKPRKEKAFSIPQLQSLLWLPLKTELEDAKQLYLVSSGQLHRINLGAIPIRQSWLLSDQYDLIQLGNSLSLLNPPKNERQINQEALLMGGIQYDLDSISEPGFWRYLPGSQIEIARIQQQLEQAGFQVESLSGNLAAEDRLQLMKKGPRLIHFATHGYFFPILDSLDQQTYSSPIRLSEHPMVRSGLILAGANHAWAGKNVPLGQEDGILTAYEISHMDLQHTELVVLSACETGLGDIKGNEGVYGLQRAFKMAGVEYLLMSLWQVPDLETQELMQHFYQAWTSGLEIRDAFKAAQLEMRKKYPNPYYWAGFVLVN